MAKVKSSSQLFQNMIETLFCCLSRLRACLPLVWNLSAVSLIPLFYISSLVRLPSPVDLSVILFCFWPILLTSYVLVLLKLLLGSFSLILHFPKGRLFCVALVFFFEW